MMSIVGYDSLPIELPRAVRPKRIGTATTRGRNGLVPKRPVTKLYESFNTDRCASFVPGSPAIFIENMIARTTKETLSLKTPGSKLYGKTRCIRKFNNILSSRDNSAIEEEKWYFKAHPKQHSSRTKTQYHFCDCSDNSKCLCIGVQNP